MRKLTKILAATLFGAITLGVVACENRNLSEQDGDITLRTNELRFKAAGETKTVAVEGRNWTATPSNDWIEVTSEGGQISVTIGEGSMEGERSGSIVVRNNSDEETITVTQDKLGSAELTVSESRLEFAHAGGLQRVTVTSEREWTATPSDDWIRIFPTSDGTGFDVELGPSTDVPQTVPQELNGSIVVSNGDTAQNKTISVWQALGVQAIIVFPHNVTLLFPDGTGQLELLALLPENATNKNVIWASDDESIVTVDQRGNLTPVAIGQARVSVTTEDNGPNGVPLSDDCLVVVANAWEPGTVTFRSNTTWEITLLGGSKRIWSDTVLSTGAEKDVFTGVSGETYIPDAMRNGSYGHMYSWEAVNQFGAQLCPAPWRVPSMNDFVDLDKALGGTGENFQATSGQEDKYRSQWGLEWAGQAFNSNLSGSGENDRANGVGYWSSTGNSNVDARLLRVTDNNENGGTPHPQINPMGIGLKQYGYLLRCVKNGD